MKLNLGAGRNPLPGYLNIDIGYKTEDTSDFGGPVEPRTVRAEVYPLPDLLKEKGVTEIRASHVLEHLPWHDTMDVLKEWVSLLKPGGVLKIAVPDFEWIARQYLAEVDEDREREPRLTAYLMGAQTDENDYHKAIFDARGLKRGMEAAGLVDVCRWEGDNGDCSTLPVSLNLQGTKPTTPERGSSWRDLGIEPRETTEPAEKAASAPQEDVHPFAWLQDRAYNKYSQWGEDGILEAIFSKIGTTNRTVIECGAGHPVRGSNSRKLIEEGWRALLVEADSAKNAALREEYSGNPNVTVDGHYAAPKSDAGKNHTGLDDLLFHYDVPIEPDLLVIDVDGQDWYLWNGLIKHRPRVVIIEFGNESAPDFVPAFEGEGQAGVDAIEALAVYKGYQPVLQMGHNLVCVDRKCSDVLAQQSETSKGNAPEGTILFQPKEIGCVLSVPRLGFMSNMQCLLSVANLGVQVWMQQGAFWGQCLTDAILKFMEDPRYRYILTVDYDSIFTSADVQNLYRYMASPGCEHVDAVTTVQVRREHDSVLLTMADADGKARGQVSAEEMAQELVQVRSAHFGLTLFRVEALRRAPHPWFLHKPDKDGKWGDGRTDEDIHFWAVWRECGNTLFLAPRVSIGHLEQVVTWPTADLTGMYQRMKDYQNGGKPAGVWK